MSTETFYNTPDDWIEQCRRFAIRELESGNPVEAVEYAKAGKELLALRIAMEGNLSAIRRLEEIRLLLQPIVDGCDVALTPREVSVDVMAIVEGN